MEQRARALVWKFFEKPDNNSTSCKKCLKNVKIPNRNTSNLRQHMRIHHSAEFKALEDDEGEQRKRVEIRQQKSLIPKQARNLDPGQRTLQDCIKGKWGKEHPRSKAITTKLVYMICKEMMPFRVVETKSFVNFVNECEPRFKLPQRKTISQELVPALYKDVMLKVHSDLQEVSSFAFTTDTWTSRTNDGYISVTVHYLTHEFEQRSHCLAVRHITETHTAINLKTVVQTILDEAKLFPGPGNNEIPLYAVADNARNIQNALSGMENVTVLSCFGHTLQLVINDAIDQTRGLKSIIAKGRNICSYFHRSSVATAKLAEVQKQMNKECHKLIQDVSTRWNSTFLMMSRLVEQQAPLSSVLSSVEKIHNLSPSEWRNARELCECLKPFDEVTSLLSGESYPTASLVIPVLNTLTNFLNSNDGLNDFKKTLLNGIKERFADYEYNTVFSASTFIDPRFKEIIFESEDAVANVKDKILNEVCQKNLASGNKETATDEGTPTSAINVADTNVSSLWSHMDKKLSKAADNTVSVQDSCLREIAQFRSEPLVQRNVSPFSWWQMNQDRYPYLSKIARQFLSVPATSVSSERMFSKAGEVISDLRTKLKPSKAEMLVTLAANL